MFNRQKLAPGGFMVVEVLVSLLLAGLLVITVGNVFSAVRRLQTESRSRQQALNYARQTLETIDATYYDQFKSYPPACVALPGYSGCWTDSDGGYNMTCVQVLDQPFYRTVTVSNIGPASRPNDIKQITVDVFWPTCGSSKKVSLSTILTAWKN